MGGGSGQPLRQRTLLTSRVWMFAALPILAIGGFFVYLAVRVTKPSSSLHDALLRNNYREVRNHILTGTPINALTCAGHTPLYTAISNRNDQITELLLEHGARADVDPKGKGSPLILASEHGDAKLVAKLLALGGDPNDTEGACSSVLHSAVDSNNAEVVHLLLEHGANPKCRLKANGDSALFNAATSGNAQIAADLLAHGADFNVRGVRGRTPLHAAAATKHFEVLQVLVKAGAQTDLPDENGVLPIASSLFMGDERSSWLLLEHYHRHQAQDFRKANMLHYAVMGGATPMLIRSLIATGCKLEQKDERGDTPLSLALKLQKTSEADALEAAGAKVPTWQIPTLTEKQRKDLYGGDVNLVR